MSKLFFLGIILTGLVAEKSCTMSQDKQSDFLEVLKRTNEYFTNIDSALLEIKQLDLPSSNGYEVHQVTHFMPRRPRQFIFAFDGVSEITSVAENKDNFFDIVKKANIDLQTTADAQQFIHTFFEVVRSQSTLSYILHSAKDIKFRPNLEGESALLRDSLIASGEETDYGMQITKKEEGFEFAYFVIVGDRLERHFGQLSKNGLIEVEKELVQEGVPTVYSY